MRIGELCAGAGQLGAAASALFPAGTAHVAWVCETDPDAARVLQHRLCTVNHGDITTVDWRKVEPVDVLVAGYPCQDLSNAGKRAGIEGAKSGIWRNVADAVRVLRPRLVCVENVRAHLARGFGRVLGAVDMPTCVRRGGLPPTGPRGGATPYTHRLSRRPGRPSSTRPGRHPRPT